MLLLDDALVIDSSFTTTSIDHTGTRTYNSSNAPVLMVIPSTVALHSIGDLIVNGRNVTAEILDLNTRVAALVDWANDEFNAGIGHGV